MSTRCIGCGTDIPDAVRNDIVSQLELESRTSSLVSDLKSQEGISPEEHEANMPGGAANADTGAQGWLWYLCWLHRKHAGDTRNMIRTPAASWSDTEAADLRDTLAEEHVMVPMSDGTSRGVYPKSDYAMRQIEYALNALNFVTPALLALESAPPSPESLAAQRTATDAHSDLERLFVWIATHPEPDVPWPEDGRNDHQPPAWTRTLAAADVPLIYKAYVEVNYRRLNVLAERTHLMNRGNDSEKATPEAFIGFMASEIGIAARDVARKRSKGSLFAVNFLKWEAMQKAEAKAKAAK